MALDRMVLTLPKDLKNDRPFSSGSAAMVTVIVSLVSWQDLKK